ncbi:MAG: pentapeptide repeat-containing protein, partial [Rickettsiales bacterium]|nr:pentapeptide repeat-containing protein [Rickettsiales bacterium]
MFLSPSLYRSSSSFFSFSKTSFSGASFSKASFSKASFSEASSSKCLMTVEFWKNIRLLTTFFISPFLNFFSSSTVIVFALMEQPGVFSIIFSIVTT